MLKSTKCFLILCACLLAGYANGQAQNRFFNVTNGNDDGPGSLREAIAQAEDGDVVQYGTSDFEVILTSGQIVIDKDITIYGKSGLVRRAPSASAFRIFRIDSGATVTIFELYIRNGRDSVFAQENGAGILNNGNLTLERCAIENNTADELYSDGGGIYNNGVLTLRDCRIAENTARGNGGGIYNRGRMAITGGEVTANASALDGGGILNDSTLVLTSCAINSNTALNGAGLANKDSLALFNCAVSGNVSTGEGGGIRNVGVLQFADGEINLNNAGKGGSLFNFGLARFDTVTANENQATHGGAFYNDGFLFLRKANVRGNRADSLGAAIANIDTLKLINCAVTGNLAGDAGGGLWNGDATACAEVVSSTIALNLALRDGNGIFNASGVVRLNSSIVAKNASIGIPIDLKGRFVSLGNNFISNIGEALLDSSECDQIGTALSSLDPHFVLYSTTIPTTFGDFNLLPQSTAINRGAADTTGLNLPETDLEGKPRLAEFRLDAGAYEYQVSAPLVVDSEGGLRNAINQASDGEKIMFRSGVTEISLTAGEIFLDKNLIIDGEERVTLNGSSRIFRIDSAATVALNGLTLANGSSNNGGAILNRGNLTMTKCVVRDNLVSGGSGGGGIANDSALIMIDCTLQNNFSDLDYFRSGGGLNNRGRALLIRTTVRNNEADGGGGIANSGRMTVTDCLIRGNDGRGSAGGISNTGVLSLTSTTVDSNLGGGLYNQSALTLANCNIAGNPGTGVYNRGVVTLTDCEIIGNIDLFAYAQGGGLANYGQMFVANCVVDSNSAPEGGGLFNGNVFSGGVLVPAFLRVANSKIRGNAAAGSESAFGGGGISNIGELHLIGSLVAGNTSSHDGGGLQVYDNGQAFVINGTIAGNEAGSQGGGVALDNFPVANVTVINTIIVANEPNSNATGHVTSGGYNIVNSPPGDFSSLPSDFTALPDFIFTDPEQNDFTLLPTSPAVDSGTPDTTGLGLLHYDLLGTFRVMNGRIDRGAYEFNDTTRTRYTISGLVRYCGADTARKIPQLSAELRRRGVPVDTVLTNAEGSFLFSNVLPDSNYRVTVGRPSGGIGFAITPTDALLAFNAYLGKNQLTGCQSLAADVDSSLSIQPSDALLIFNRFLGIYEKFPIDDWRVFPAEYEIDASPQAWRETPEAVIDLPLVAADTIAPELRAVVRGDVNLNWQPPAQQAQSVLQQMTALEKNANAPVRLSLSIRQDEGETKLLTLQVRIEGEALQQGLNSIGAELRYDDAALEIVATEWGEAMPAEGFEVGRNLVIEARHNDEIAALLKGNLFNGTVRFGGFATAGAAIKRSGVLFEIKARLWREMDVDAALPVQLLAASATALSQQAPGFKSLEVAIVNAPGSLAQIPAEFALAPNYPNPFNPTTKIRYQLPEAAAVELAIFNVLGQKVRSLVHAQNQTAGFYNVEWGGRDDLGRTAASGLYFYRIEARTPTRAFTFTRKMTFLK